MPFQTGIPNEPDSSLLSMLRSINRSKMVIRKDQRQRGEGSSPGMHTTMKHGWCCKCLLHLIFGYYHNDSEYYSPSKATLFPYGTRFGADWSSVGFTTLPATFSERFPQQSGWSVRYLGTVHKLRLIGGYNNWYLIMIARILLLILFLAAMVPANSCHCKINEACHNGVCVPLPPITIRWKEWSDDLSDICIEALNEYEQPADAFRQMLCSILDRSIQEFLSIVR